MPRGIDHLVLAVRDLDAAAAFYTRLGFRVGAQNRHDWGTLNRLVQFDGCFLELITGEPGFRRPSPGEPVERFAGVIADYLARREGLAMLVLESRDAARDRAEFDACGIGNGETFFFERRGRKPDGSDVHVAFTLALVKSPRPDEAGFFVCQQHVPENFWNPAFQRHANGVTGIAAVTYLAADHEAAPIVDFLARFSGAPPHVLDGGGVGLDTGRGVVEVMSPARLTARLGAEAIAGSGARAGFASVRFGCDDPDRVAALLSQNGVPHVQAGATLVVPADAARGVALVFESDRSGTP